jgi:hypothetical protein
MLDELRELRGADQTFKTFGSTKHQFHTHPVLAEDTVRDFEELHRVRLPPEYRGFLLSIGNGGAGPYYGVFKLGEMDDGFGYKAWRENEGFVGVLSAPFPHTKPWNDPSGMPEFDDSRAGDREWEDEYCRRRDAWNKRYWNTANVNGAIPICHQGCAYRDWLIVTGPEAGNVWTDSRADHAGLFPAQQQDGGRVTFLQWYRSWLHDTLRAVRNGNASREYGGR